MKMVQPIRGQKSLYKLYNIKYFVFCSQPMEGQLYKYTNVVKGWQYRWFMMDPHKGTLEYYMVSSSAVVGMFFPYRHVEIIGSRRRHACRHNSSFKVE